MADLSRSFLDFRPLCKLHILLPSKNFSFTHVYSHSSSINRIKQKPLHLALFSNPSSPTPSSRDVISTHEHSDGGLTFRFGAHEEDASNVQKGEAKVEKKEIERKGLEDHRALEVLNSDRDGGMNDSSSLTEVTDESNLLVVDGTNISIVEKDNGLDEKLKNDKEFELLNIVSIVDLKDSSTPSTDVENTGDSGDDEQENSTVTSVRSNFDIISTHKHSDGSLIFRFGDLSQAASNVRMEDPEVENDEIERKGVEESRVVMDLNEDDDGGGSGPSLGNNIENIGIDEECLNEAQDYSSPASIDTAGSTELSADSKYGGDVDETMSMAPGREAARFSVDAEAQTSLNVTESQNDIAEDGNESGSTKLMSMSPQLKTGATVDEGPGHVDMGEYGEIEKAKSPMLLDNKLQESLPQSESTEGDNVNDDLVESSGTQVMELEQTEADTNSQEIRMAALVLSSGAALLPHPSKVLTGAEDAYFVTGKSQMWLGLADGVGQWSLEGTNPGVYAQELIRNCEKLVVECNGNALSHPVELLKLSINETQSPGSSTILLARVVGQVLQVANIGDSGFIILRHGSVHKRSSPMLHAFHFPLQIERGDDPLILAEFYRIDLEEEDVIIVASDGLLDNLYDQEISSRVSKYLAADRKLEEIAEALATKAQEVGKSASARSPFADSAQAAGYAGYTGGKLDDVTVIVSVVQRRSNSQTS